MPMPQIQFVKLVFAGLLLFWTLAVITAFFMAREYIQQSKFDLVKSMARMSLQKDVAYRHLFASLDRIYVPRQPGVEANPFLNFPQKELVTKEGIHLVQLNPTYMTRLFYEMDSRDAANARASLVSLRPVNSQNAPDQWQEKTLKSFRKGKQKASTIQETGNGRHLRLMQPLKIGQDCLRCHAKQGYEMGDIRGGISLSMPLSHYKNSLQKDQRILTMGLGLVWMAGVFGMGFLGRQLAHRVRERDQYSARLQHLSLHDPLTGLYNRFAFDHEDDHMYEDKKTKRQPGLHQIHLQILPCSARFYPDLLSKPKAGIP